MVRINTVWDRTTEVLRGRATILATLAIVYVFVPSVVSAGFTSFAASRGSGSLTGAILSLAVAVLLLMGMLAITAVASNPAVDTAAAHVAARRRILPALGLMVVLGVVAALGAIPLGIALAAGGARVNSATGQLDMSAASAGSAAMGGVVGLLLLALMLWLSAKIVPLFAVIVNERRGLGAFRRSFQLTRGRALRLIGVLILLFIVTVVVMLAATSVVGVIARLLLGEDGAATAGFIVAIVSAAVTSVVTVVQIVFYTQFYVAAVDAEGVAPAA